MRPKPRTLHVAMMALAATLLGGCAARGPHPAGAENDPIEGFNRKIFWFNDKVDNYVLEPAAKGWDFVMPHPVQRSVSRFFDNLRFPINFLNDALQGKVRNSAVDVARFGINTTIGVVGFLDPAAKWGLERHNEDFGQTLGVWGVPPGPYLVLPLLGPSSPRDAVGLGVDYCFSIAPFFVDQWILIAARAVDIVNERSMVLKEVKSAREASFDYYTFVRNAYFQRRRALINDSAKTEGREQEDQDLYNVEPSK